MTRISNGLLAIFGAGAAVLATSINLRAADAPQAPSVSTASAPERMAIMRHHFIEVSDVHDAVIRGDLTAIRESAEALAVIRIPPEVPESATRYVVALRAAAQRASRATTLASAATATVSMLGQCAACHQAIGIRPTPAPRSSPDVGGLVGHMLEHQRAADELLHGLVIPSDSEWLAGVARLRTAPLRRGALLPDQRFAGDQRKADEVVHAIAAEAASAETADRREATYGRLMTTCAQCHGLHKTIWGPGRQRP